MTSAEIDAMLESTRKRVCKCGKEFEPTNPQQTRCSRLCRVGRERGQDPTVYKCEHCGKFYQRKRGRSKNEGKRFCSRECALPHNSGNNKRCRPIGTVLARAIESLRRLFEHERATEQSTTIHVRIRRGRPRVSLKQMKATKKKAKRNSRRRRRALGLEESRTHRSRARRCGVPYEPINFRAVWERDRGRCQVCLVETPWRLRGTCDDRAPELGHIVPVARGGGHLYSNVQCECRACNGKRGVLLLSEYNQAA